MILVGFMLARVLPLCLLYRKDPAESCWCVATVTKAKGSASINTDMRAFQCVRLCVCVWVWVSPDSDEKWFEVSQNLWLELYVFCFFVFLIWGY